MAKRPVEKIDLRPYGAAVKKALISLTQEIIFTASQYVFGRCFAENWMVLEL